jgi:hypothetical protein
MIRKKDKLKGIRKGTVCLKMNFIEELFGNKYPGQFLNGSASLGEVQGRAILPQS